MPILVIFLLISFFSYIFTYQEDQVVVEAFLKNFSLNTSVNVKNFGGIYGAVLSYLFIYKYFGFISSLIILYLMLLYGVKLARFKYFDKWDEWKIFSLSVLLIFILNSSIGIFHLENFFNGHFSGFLSTALGAMMLRFFGVGAYLIVVLLVLTFLFFSFESNIKKHFIKEDEDDIEKNVIKTDDKGDIFDLKEEVEN